MQRSLRSPSLIPVRCFSLLLRWWLTMLVLLVLLLPGGVARAASASVSLLYGEYQLPQLILMDDPAVQIDGERWRGTLTLPTLADGPVPLVALTARESRLEATCATATTTVGVQFLGDGNDGHAKITVGERELVVETRGGAVVYDRYVEFTNLPLAQHTIQVEPTVVAGEQSAHVTVVALGCGPITSVAPQTFAERSVTVGGEGLDGNPAQRLYLPHIST